MGDLFQLDARSLASELVGRRLIVGHCIATIIETKSYPRRDTEKPLYRKLLELEPGGVSTSRQYNSVLCHVLARGGGCVAIRTIEIGGMRIEGPGRVTEALGLTTPKATGRLRELSNGDLTIEMRTPIDVPTSPPERRKRKSDRMNRTALTRLMPQLVRRWLDLPLKTRGSFPTYINEMLRACRNERELRRYLA